MSLSIAIIAIVFFSFVGGLFPGIFIGVTLQERHARALSEESDV